MKITIATDEDAHHMSHDTYTAAYIYLACMVRQ